MNITGPLIERIAEQMVYGIDDVLVVGRYFVGGFQPDVLLQIA